MQLQQLTYVLEVAKQGSINKAAEALLLTQPNLSRAISNLEEEIGIQIFYRDNKGVCLTEDGKKLHEYALVILSQMEIISRMSVKPCGRKLHLSAYPIPLTARALSEYYNENKEADLSIQLIEARMDQVISDVNSGRSEAGIIHYNNRQAKEVEHELDYKGLERHRMSQDTWYVTVGRNSPFYAWEEVSVHDLKNYASVRAPDDYFANLTSYLKVDSVSLGSFRPIYMNNMASVITFIQNTDSFRFAPGWSKGDFEREGLRMLRLKNSDIVVYSAWIKRRKEALSLEMEAFLRLLQEYYQSTDSK